MSGTTFAEAKIERKHIVEEDFREEPAIDLEKEEREKRERELAAQREREEREREEREREERERQEREAEEMVIEEEPIDLEPEIPLPMQDTSRRGSCRTLRSLK